MKIAYLLYRENIFSPLVETQVINNLIKIAKYKQTEIFLIWLKRVDYYVRSNKKIRSTVLTLESNGIKVKQIPIVVGKFPLNEQMEQSVYNQCKKKVMLFLKNNDIDIVHTRGYDAGLFITKLKKEFQLDIEHLFDPRSPFLTEIVSTYNVKENGKLFNYWKEQEKEIIKSASAVVGVSEEFCKYLKRYSNAIEYIPNNSDMENLDDILSRIKKQRRNTICYVGSIGYGWNNVLIYADFVKRLIEIDDEINFEFYVLKEGINVVNTEFEKKEIPPNRYKVSSLPAAEIPQNIAGCLAGLQLMKVPDHRLGIKTVNYLSAGVPIICNNNAIGAAHIVEKEGLGWNIDSMNLSLVLKEMREKRTLCEMCIENAYNNYSTDVVSGKYLAVYEKIMNHNKI